MLLFYQSLTYQYSKNRGGLAIFGKPHATTDFEGLGIEAFHRKVTENSPKKFEVSDLGVLNPCHN